MNNIVVIPPYTQDIFSSIKLYPGVGSGDFIFVISLSFVVKIVIKDLYFVTCNNILEKRVSSLP